MQQTYISQVCNRRPSARYTTNVHLPGMKRVHQPYTQQTSICQYATDVHLPGMQKNVHQPCMKQTATGRYATDVHLPGMQKHVHQPCMQQTSISQVCNRRPYNPHVFWVNKGGLNIPTDAFCGLSSIPPCEMKHTNQQKEHGLFSYQIVSVRPHT